MQDKAIYHASAVEYNTKFGDLAADLAECLEDPQVKKWCLSIAKQHRYHQARHQRALDKLQTVEAEPENSIARQQAEWAEQQIAAEATEAAVEMGTVSIGAAPIDEEGLHQAAAAILDQDVCPDEAYHVEEGTGLFDARGHHITQERWNQLNENTEA